jgi:nicotinamidase-related amidase
MAVWDNYLSEQDKEHVAAGHVRPRFGFGSKPVIISIDNYRSVIGDEPLPLLESAKTWPSSTGPAGWEALANIATLFEDARASGIPIVHITGLAEEDSGVKGWGRSREAKAPTDPVALDRHTRRFDIVEQAAPLPGEVILHKSAPSAFFGTLLMSHLNAIGADTLIVCGESTSGCVRASVVDGRSYRFKVVVVEECVYDRHQASHAINLFDMNQKYADVLPLEDVKAWMDEYAGLVATPAG